MEENKRKSISKKLRFDIFKRDLFKCAYCGNEPPAVILEIDHIEPVSKGGTNDKNNLITACLDCNRGKGARSLSFVPNPLNENILLLKEKEEQIKEYRKFFNKIQKRRLSDMEKINTIYSRWLKGYSLNPNFMNTSLKKFLDRLPIHTVEEAMENACNYLQDPDDSLKYFCGICWRKIKGD